MECPRCSVTLEKVRYGNIIGFHCPHCHGIAVTISGLRTLGVDPGNVFNIWTSANAGKLGCELSCPECDNPMRITKINDGESIFYIDVCIKCQLIWFDFGELDKIPADAINNADQLPPQAREIIAINRVRNIDTPDEPPTLLENLGIDQLWCSTALRLLLRLIFRI